MKRAVVLCAALASFCSGCSAPVVQTCQSTSDCPAASSCVQGFCISGDIGVIQRKLTVVRAGDGAVRSTPAGIDCGSTCSGTFPDGTEVSLAATPGDHFAFDGWGGGCSGKDTCKVKLATDAQVVATFKDTTPVPVDKVVVTVSPTGTGTGKVTSVPAGLDCPSTCEARFNKGDTITLTAVATDRFSFGGWSGPCSGTGTCSFKADAATSVSARFDDPCDGLTPATPPPPITFTSTPTTPASFGGCEPGAGDGNGNIAVAWWAAGAPPRSWNHTFLDPGGTILGSATYAGLRSVAGQAAGYEGVSDDGSSKLYLLDAKGAPVKPPAPFTGASQGFNDPTGGLVVYDSGLKQIRAFDDKAAERWHVSFTEPGFRLLAVDRTGQVLVLFDGTGRYGAGTLAGLWIGHDGAIAGSIFRAADALSPTGVLDLAARVGDGLFLSQDGKWLRQFPSRGTGSQPAPDWLAAKAATKLRMARGGRAYALLSLDSSTATACSSQIEIVEPGGRSCGTVPLPTSTGPCKSGALEITYQGTVLQLLPQPATCSSCSCSWRWYQGLLK